MTQWNAESMHRLAKLALDAGEVSTPEEALELFSRYRLHLHLGAGWADTLAGQACFLTALNTAVRAFLGGVVVLIMMAMAAALDFRAAAAARLFRLFRGTG